MRAVDLINKWALEEPPRIDSKSISSYLEFLEKTVEQEYEPTTSPQSHFSTRLDAWLENVDNEEDKLTLVRLLSRILFVTRKQFESLYRVAIDFNATTWLVDQLGIRVLEPSVSRNLRNALSRSWICPITDSLRINAFYKANGIKGRSFRPDWRSLSRFGDSAKLQDFVRTSSIDRLILVEDFVGSGQQVKEVLDFAITSLPDTPILFVPLLICSDGLKAIKRLEKRHPHFTVSEVVELPYQFVIHRTSVGDKLEDTVRDLIIKYNSRVKVRGSGPYGYGSVGGLVVLHTNCPNNSLPILHRKKHTWSPLFPRIER